jgi:predicted transcriptional regulator
MPQYEKASKKSIKTKSPRDIMDGKLQVNDMVISDEYVLAEKDSDGKKVSELLLEHKEDALLIKEGDKIVGIVNVYSILKAIADGKIELGLKAKDLMDTEILEVKENDTLEEVLPEMYEKQPQAVIVTDEEGNFVGYFSPKDCKLASMKLNFFEE